MTDKADIWIPLYIGDYLAATTHLSAMESGAYLHLLMHQWKNGSLPASSEALRRIARVEQDAWSDAWEMLKAFFDFSTGSPVQMKLEKIRSEWTEKKAKAVSKAKVAADSRWKNASSIAQAVPQSCPSSSPSPSQIEKEGILAREQVEIVYRAYPRHVGKNAAVKAIRAAVSHLGAGKDVPRMNPPDALAYLRARAETFARSPAGNAGKYTPHPATWFNEHRYLDEENEWQKEGQHAANHRSANRGQDLEDAAVRTLIAVRSERSAAAGGAGEDAHGAGNRPQGAPGAARPQGLLGSLGL